MLRKILFALVPLLVLLVGLELALRALGMGAHEANRTRGFDTGERYLIPDPEVPGGFLPGYLDGKFKEFKIPPKGDELRVLLFGGSNTRGFPHHYLAQVLNRKAEYANPGFEVINLGRQGYGSKRVAILFAQALQLEPDVVVIYSGHNEFIEYSFQLELEEEWSGAESTLAGLAEHLRTYNVLVSAFETPPEEREVDAQDVAPERWQWEYERFAGYTYDQTLEHLEGYRENLEFMCRTAAEHGVDVLLCTVVGNMLDAPFVNTPPPSLGAAERGRLDQLLARAHEAIPERFRGLVREEGDRMHPKDWEFPKRESRPGAVAPRLRPLLGVLAERETWWPEPGLWAPRVEPFLRILEGFHARALEDGERADLEEARGVLEEALALCPDHPLAHFRLGLVHYLLGDDGQAAEHLRLAGRYDRAPRRGNDLTNGIVRAVAGAQPAVHFLDLEELFLARTPSGITGYEMFLDNCHFHEAVLPIVMQDVARALLPICAERLTP